MVPYIVIDASVAGAWLFAEAYSAEAQAVFEAVVSRRVIGLAPDRFEEELLRVCQKKVQPPPMGANLSPADSFARFLDLVTAPMPLYLLPSQDLHERAWELAVATPKLTTHDALYLALAERWDAELWTLDGGLASRAASVYARVFDLRLVSFSH